jgi:hypothetical protein
MPSAGIMHRNGLIEALHILCGACKYIEHWEEYSCIDMFSA